jgi:hypothetical protein
MKSLTTHQNAIKEKTQNERAKGKNHKSRKPPKENERGNKTLDLVRK